MPMRREVNKNFFKKWTPEMAYVLGFFAADGSMLKNNRGGCYLEFQVADRSALVQIQKAMKSNHKISKRKERNKKWKDHYRIQIGSKEIFNDLVKFGFMPAKTKIMKMPDISGQHISDFVRGYFDGDGCVYFKKHKRSDNGREAWVFTSRFTSGHKPFLEQLWGILKKHGLKGGCLYDKIGGHELVFSRHDSLALYRLMYNNSDCCCLERKRKVFQKAIQTLKLDDSAGVV